MRTADAAGGTTLTGTAARFCKACGARYASDSAAFCNKCGAARPEAGAAAVPTTAEPPAVLTVRSARARGVPTSGSPPPAAPPPAVRAAQGAVRQAAGVAGAVTGAAGLTAALPWQTIRAGGPVDVRAFLAAAAPGAATTVVSRSLKRPGLVLAFTVAIGVAVALLTGGSSALVSALPRLLTGAVAAILSIATGSRTGPLRTITGIVSAVTALVALVSLGGTLYQGIAGDEALLVLLPTAIAVASTLLAAVKTTLVALRRS